MEAKTLPIYNVEGKEIDSVKLDAKVFDGVVNTAAMHSAVNSFRANQRRGLACVKSRGEVSGGGKKPWKQKGTGRARVGSNRSPLWRHGGVTFGPVPHDFGFDIPQKIRELALKSSLNAKLNENSIIVLDALKLDNGKTKDAAKIFSNLKAADTKRKKSTLLLIHAFDDKLKLALRNLSFVNVNLATQTNTYEVFSHKRIVITKDGLQDLTHRLKK